MVGDRLASGTASEASANLLDANAGSGLAKFDTDSDPRITDKMVTIWAGTRAGDSVRANTYNASTLTIVPFPAFSGSLATSSKYIIHDRFTFDDYLDALKRAQRMLTFDPSLKRGMMAETGSHREIMIGNALVNPTFDLYTTANAPDGWTEANSTLTMLTDVTYGGARRSLNVATDGSNVANLNQQIGRQGRWKGTNFTAWAWVYTETANEVYLRVSDGTDDNDSATHSGNGWEKLEAQVSVEDSVDSMRTAIRTTTASASVNFRVQAIYVPIEPNHDHVYALDSDINLIALDGNLRVSSGAFTDVGSSGVNDFDGIIPPTAWEVTHDSTRGIRLKIGSAYNGHILEYTGYKAHTALTAVGTTWADSIEGILEVAAAILHSTKVAPGAAPSISSAPTFGPATSVEAARVGALIKYGRKISNAKQVERII